MAEEAKNTQTLLNPEGYFFVKKGVKEDVCQDMVVYLNQQVNLYLTNPRYMIPKEFDPFHPPKNKKSIDELRYAIAETQLLIKQYNTRNANKKMLEQFFVDLNEIKKRLTEQMELGLIRIDVNNDGSHESVLTSSSFLARFNSWRHFGLVLDDSLNLNAAFKRGAHVGGEIFFYKNRTYSLARYKSYPPFKYATVLISRHSFVNEPYTPSSAEKSIGLSQHNICQLPFAKPQ